MNRSHDADRLVAHGVTGLPGEQLIVYGAAACAGLVAGRQHAQECISERARFVVATDTVADQSLLRKTAIRLGRSDKRHPKRESLDRLD